MNGVDLARARSALGVSRVEFAQRLGVPWTMLRQCEVADTAVPVEWAVREALALGGPKHTTNQPSQYALAAARRSVQHHIAQE